MVDSLATVALETLRDLLVEEVKFLSGVSDQVEQVERDLKTMHSLLMDADKWSERYDPASLSDWVGKLKDLAYKAENVLEKYAYEVRSKKDLKKKLKKFACILSECFSVHEIGNEIEDVRSQMTDLTERLRSMPRRDGSSNAVDDDQRHLMRLRFAHEVEQHFVGMEEDISRLVSMVTLTDDRKVVSICGMGGLGKTTLARKIYHHVDVQRRFEARAWACVTQQFQAETVLREILKQFLPEEKSSQVDSMGYSELVRKVHEFMEEKKCLIVIDDIWEMDHWNILQKALSTNSCKVVLTTRKENVVSDEEANVHKLRLLTEDEGWELLQKIALLPKMNDAPVLQIGLRSLEDIGREIVQKCGRLPLAISVIGGILRQKQTMVEWEKVHFNIDSYLAHGESIGNYARVKQVLSLSYDALPYFLKPCFLYLGCFPEDNEIDTDRLYLLWMAEGLISFEEKGRNETLRDVAERYLAELAFRCMVQVKKEKIHIVHNKFESCRLHDLMRDLCLSKAEEEKFLKCISIPNNQYKVMPSSSGSSASTRRLAICVDNATTSLSINGIHQLEDLRSFLILNRKWCNLGILRFENIIINFEKSKCLRTLVLEGCEIEGRVLPSKVSKLIHLRYLSLFCNHVEKLPPSVCNMPYLQTLDLRVHHEYSIKLPNVICKMKRLRHLFLDEFDVIGREKLILDGLIELETLNWIGSDKVCIADIPKLTNLRQLNVTVKDMDSLSMIAQHMSNNQSQLRGIHLVVESCDLSSEEGTNVVKNILMSRSLIDLIIEDCKISCGFPCYQQGMCKNLVELMFSSSKIDGDVIQELGKYPMLQLLNLESGQELVKAEMVCAANSFPELRTLFLQKLPNLKKWEVEEGAMPKLTDLSIVECVNLEMIPNGLRFISTLRELRSYFMPKEFNDRIRVDVNGQPGEDYDKVRHIPSISIIEETTRSDSLPPEDDGTTA